MGKFGCLQQLTFLKKEWFFANGKSGENWKWAGVLAVPVKDEEKEKYPIPNKEGEFYTLRMDMETIIEFDEGNFLDALEYIGVFDEAEVGFPE